MNQPPPIPIIDCRLWYICVSAAFNNLIFEEFMTLLLFFLACNKTKDTAEAGSTSTDVSQFDQTCVEDADCMAVTNGDLCGCACANSGINIAEADAWSAHYDEAFANCDPTMMPDCAACFPVEGYCDDGTCDAREATE